MTPACGRAALTPLPPHFPPPLQVLRPPEGMAWAEELSQLSREVLRTLFEWMCEFIHRQTQVCTLDTFPEELNSNALFFSI